MSLTILLTIMDKNDRSPVFRWGHVSGHDFIAA